MNVLVINCGSSSLKYQVLDMTTETLLAKGLVERIGMDGSMIKHEKTGMDKVKKEVPMKDHKDAIKQVLDAVQNPEYGVVKSMEEIGAVGHRVVHAGEKFADSVLITDEVIAALEECVELAPLIQLSTRLCRLNLICMQFLTNFMKSTESEDTVSTELLINMLHREQQICSMSTSMI